MNPATPNGLSEAALSLCRSVSVDVDQEASFGFGGPAETMIEAPANVRRGIYDVDFIGGFTYLGGRETFLRHVASIGRFCSIASNVVAGQMEHPVEFLSPHPLFEGAFEWAPLAPFRAANAGMIEKAARVASASLGARFGKIVIGNDVWIGEGVFIRRGVKIGDGAIIASRSVVVKDVPPYAIIGGTPAKVIRSRFEPSIVAELQRLNWWNYGLSALQQVDFTDIEGAIATIDRNITSGVAEPYSAPLVRIDAHRVASTWTYDATAGELIPGT